MAALQEAILSTTPQEVYDRLVTIPEDYPVDPSAGCCCPLHEFFVERYHEEVEAADDEIHVQIGFVRFDREEYALPDWADEYQEMMIYHRNVATMGEAVELLAEMYGIERE